MSSWVKLKTLDVNMSLHLPLLSEDSGMSESTGTHTAPQTLQELETVHSSPGSSTGLLSPDIVARSPGSASNSSATDAQPKKKKLVWAADVSDMREPADVGNGIGTDGMVENGMGTGAHSSPPSGGLLSPVIVPHLQERPQSYLLFEERGQEEGEGYIHVKRERSRSSFFAGNSVVSEGDIEDQYEYRGSVEIPSSNPDGSSITTAQELQICKKTVLKPFLVFLKLIGWRSFFLSRQDMTSSRCVKIFNVMYPLVLFSLLVLSCATQVVTCFYRDQPVQPAKAYTKNGTIIINCKENLFTRLIFPDLLLLFAYLWGLYIFRFGAPENLITLVETVFLSTQHIRKGQTKMVGFMRFCMAAALLWLVIDMSVSIARVFSLQLLGSNSYLYFLSNLENKTNGTRSHTTTENVLRFSFVILDFFAFIFFDLLYLAVIVTYIAQCQLIRMYIGGIIDKVLLKLRGYTLEQAMVDINNTYKFLQVLNGKISFLTSICLLVFMEAAVSSLRAVFTLDTPDDGIDKLGIAVGVCNTILWCIIAAVPILQAARLTSRCQQLRRLGLSIGHRPFTYNNTPQLLLDSFVQYTDATRYRAKLAGIPVYPSYVIGGFFFLILLGSFLLIFFPTTRIAPWF